MGNTLIDTIIFVVLLVAVFYAFYALFKRSN